MIVLVFHKETVEKKNDRDIYLFSVVVMCARRITMTNGKWEIGAREKRAKPRGIFRFAVPSTFNSISFCFFFSFSFLAVHSNIAAVTLICSLPHTHKHVRVAVMEAQEVGEMAVATKLITHAPLTFSIKNEKLLFRHPRKKDHNFSWEKQSDRGNSSIFTTPLLLYRKYYSIRK